MKIDFQLNSVEIVSLFKWTISHKCSAPLGYSEDPSTTQPGSYPRIIKFDQGYSGIGSVTIVTCSGCNQTCDITDLDCW